MARLTRNEELTTDFTDDTDKRTAIAAPISLLSVKSVVNRVKASDAI